MIFPRTTCVLLATFLTSCGGTQKAPEVTASEPGQPAASAIAESPNSKTEVAAKAAEPEADAAAAGPECKKDDECTIFADCCTCKAVPASKPLLVPCDSVCGESKCEVKEITIANVACDAGRCVIKKKK